MTMTMRHNPQTEDNAIWWPQRLDTFNNPQLFQAPVQDGDRLMMYNKAAFATHWNHQRSSHQQSILTKTAENAKGTGLQQSNVTSETFARHNCKDTFEPFLYLNFCRHEPELTKLSLAIFHSHSRKIINNGELLEALENMGIMFELTFAHPGGVDLRT
jgi:hypothetical protein